LIFWNFDN